MLYSADSFAKQQKLYSTLKIKNVFSHGSMESETYSNSKNMKIADRWRKKVEDTQLFYHEKNKFNENVKFVHFTTSLNKPHESKLYKY